MRKVLIATQEEEDRNHLREILEHDYELVEVESGREAVSLMYKEYKLLSAVIIDLHSPELDGFRVLKLRRDNPVLFQIPTIVIADEADREGRAMAIDLGANDMLLKPFSSENVLNCLHQHIVKNKQDSGIAMGIDRLTKISNRALLFESAERLIHDHEPGHYILSCINIDHFKVINDQFGVGVGNQVLKHIADALGKCMERVGGICGRITADDFAALFPADEADSPVLADAYREAILPTCIDNKIRLRIGRYLVTDATASISTIYDRAKIAADSLRGNYERFIQEYNDTMRSDLVRELQISNDMEQALKAGEFEPWFQPQYNHSTGAMVGAEALVRWKRDGTYISPAEFIPLFEQNGFIYEMDQYIWERVCIQLRSWLDEGMAPLPVSVNISRRDFFHDDFMDTLLNIVKRYHIPYDLLRLEVTESAFAESTKTLLEKVNLLIKQGFTVEIDDFGSGYSSLNTLKDVSAAVLKLDMRFFENAENRQREGNIVEAVVRMAKWLDMAVIAEGVEEKAQADYLKSIGCLYIQGFYYAKPMPLNEFEQLLHQTEKEPELARMKTLVTLDNNEFWNPKSLETLIFNSYVGAACIFEINERKAELLRTNERYNAILGELLPVGMKLDADILSKIMDAKDGKALFEMLRSAADNRQEASCEVKLKKNKAMFIRVMARMIAEAGDRKLFYCVIDDMTEQRVAEQKERAISEQMQAIMDNVHGGITATVFHSKHEVHITFANNGFYSMFGFTKDQMAEEIKSPLDLIVAEDRERTMETVMRIVHNRSSETYEYRCHKRDGSMIWVQCTNSVISNNEDNDTLLLAVMTDITALRKLQQKERETAEKLESVLNNAENGITAVVLNKEEPEFLFANSKYYKIHGISKHGRKYHTMQETLQLIHPDDREAVGAYMLEAAQTGKRTELEYRIVRPDGKTVWVKAVLSTAHFAELDKPVQVSVFMDITAEKEANAQLRFLNDSAHDILSQEDTESAINTTLERFNAYFDGDRAFLMEYNESGHMLKNTYEVCAKGTPSKRAAMQSLPLHISQEGLEKLRQNRFIKISLEDAKRKENRFVHIDVPTPTEQERKTMRDILLEQGVHELIFAPLWGADKLVGIIGVEQPTKAMNQLDRIKALTDYISVLLNRRDLTGKVAQKNNDMERMLNDTPGGFLCMELHESANPSIISMNKGFCRMMGMEQDEVMERFGVNACRCIAPEDLPAVCEEMRKPHDDGDQYIGKCRLCRSNGDLLWVMISGRFFTAENGRRCLNLYFTDITLQRQAEEQQKELLDNLPCGAALFEYDDNKTHVIHINQSYWDLVGREPTDYSKGSIFGVVHQEDRPLIYHEISAALKQKRNIQVNLRIYCGKVGYKPFHIEAKVIETENGTHRFFAAFTPISNETMSIQEMLPVALSTVMSTSDDYSYVKDKDLRYICCSESLSKVLGLESPKEIEGKTVFDLYEEKLALSLHKRDEAVLNSGKAIINHVEQITRSDNTGISLINTSKYPILDTQGNVVGLYGVSYDVTAQKEKESQLKLLTSTIPGGLASYLITPKGMKLIYFNEGYYQVMGYSREEYLRKTEQEPLALVYEEDRERLYALIQEFLQNRAFDKTCGSMCRCLTKDGKVKWMSIKAVISLMEDEQAVLNVVQMDVTEQMEKERQQIDLLDNLPCGAGLYEYDGKTLRAIHLNKQYAHLVNRGKINTTQGYHPMEYVRPDDHGIIKQALNDALKSGGMAACDVHLRYGDDRYRYFHLSANVAKKSEGGCFYYVTYTPIEEQELSFRNALPFIFSTIMQSTTDLATAKDRNFHYLCCSRPFAIAMGLENEQAVVGKTDYDLFPKELADRLRKADSELIAAGIPQIDVEEEIPNTKGMPRYMRSSKHLLHNASGEVVGIYSAGREITEERETYEQLRSLTNSIPGGIATFHCNEQGVHFAFFSDGICALAEYNREEYVKWVNDPKELVFDEDWHIVTEQIATLMQGAVSVECNFRIRTKSGGYKWLSCMANVVDRYPGELVANAVMTDITSQQEEKERLRLAEEEYRIAVRHSGHTIGRYDIEKRTLTITEDTAARLMLPECISDVPYGRVRLGKISKATAHSYIEFYEKVMHGEKECSVTFQKLLSTGWRWITERATTLFDDNGKPVSAIISYVDVTEQQEKEAVYSKWQQSLSERPADTYTLFRSNLSKGFSFDSREGKLLTVDFENINQRSDELVMLYLKQYVFSKDREKFAAFLNANALLANYYRGNRSGTLEYREQMADGNIRWLRLTVDLVEYPNSKDIEIYMMFENVDNEKRAELEILERAETDPLTGVLNRTTFAQKVDQCILQSGKTEQHALLMLDIDDFKQVNDAFGHSTGDQTLIGMASLLKKDLRRDDLVGRLGGDEFVVFLSDIPDEQIAAKKAQHICEISRKAYNVHVRVSSSVGVAIYPQDGKNFSELYHNADKTLYEVKRNGKDSYAFSHEEEKQPQREQAQQ